MNYFYSSVTVPHKYLLETELEVNHRSALILISVRRERRKRRRIWLQKQERRQAEYTWH